MNKITNLSGALQHFFNQTAERISTEAGFINRKLIGSSFIEALVLGNLGHGNCSIEGFCQFLYEDRITITKQGLDFRFTTLAATFMEKMFYESLNIFKHSLPLDEYGSLNAPQKIAEKWNMLIHNWASTISQLDIYFEGRLKIDLQS